MKTDIQIEHWAHMLDEAFDKRNDAEKNDVKLLPKGVDEKFTFDDVFFSGPELDEKGIEKVFDEIDPKWINVLDDILNHDYSDIEVVGQQYDVDDWDVWEISLKDAYHGGLDAIADYVIDAVYDGEQWSGKTVSLKEIFEDVVAQLAENVSSEIEISRLEDIGKLVHKGYKRYGGHYPLH